MTKYDHSEFMPKADKPEEAAGEAVTGAADEQEQIAVSETETEQKSDETDAVANANISDPERGVVVGAGLSLAWARYISAFFSPLLIPTYCMAIAMWITPLSAINENTRLGATLMILVLTAVAPLTYILAMARLGRIHSVDMRERSQRIGPCLVNIVCLLAAAFYLYKSMAPEWLFMMMVAGAVNALVFFGINFFTLLSGHTTAMGALTAYVCYIGKCGLLDMPVTIWVIVIVLLSGLVGSARMALQRHKALDVGLGYVVGFLVTYLVMNIHFVNALTIEN